MNRTEILNRLVEIAPGAINTFTKPGQPHCVMATTIGQMVLNHFGVESFPYPVEVRITNKAWADWATAGYGGGRAEQERRGAYLLSNTPNFNGASFKTVEVAKPWDGHLVLRVPGGKGKPAWIVDLDMGSFNRPQHGIMLPDGLLAELSSDGRLAGTLVASDAIQTTVEYRPLVASYRDDYQTSKDWVERDRLIGHVNELARAIRGG